MSAIIHLMIRNGEPIHGREEAHIDEAHINMEPDNVHGSLELEDGTPIRVQRFTRPGVWFEVDSEGLHYPKTV